LGTDSFANFAGTSSVNIYTLFGANDFPETAALIDSGIKKDG